MPYHWSRPADGPEHLHLVPYSALSRPGFAWFIGATALLITLPLLSVIATPVFWGLLPFLLITLAVIWLALKRSWTDRAITEDLELSRDHISLTRRGPRGRLQSWEANPYWVSVHLYPNEGEHSGPVPDYLTLRGGAREVELGAFLVPEERRRLAQELREALARARAAGRA